ncbi:MAG: outer membrane protein assembly factor BamD [Acidimicrobiia bacterium]|nr:outer membrane protein assembly factor BamD [Acidimicrobiia bacterium]
MRRALAIVLACLAVACGGQGNVIPPGTAEPDKYLFTRGNEELEARNWLNARTYFQRIVDGYPQSPLRADAKLGIGETYLGENSSESAVMAVNEFREFLNFYPTNAKADLAQYKLAMSHFQRMRAPERDQTETREAIREFDAFFERFPDSPLTNEVREKWREARDRLTQASVNVGLFYFRAARWYPGAIARFREVLAEDPDFSRMDEVYFHLAESLARTNKEAEALPYFERLLSEYPESEYGEETRQRLEALKNPAPPASPGAE